MLISQGGTSWSANHQTRPSLPPVILPSLSSLWAPVKVPDLNLEPWPPVALS